MFPLLSFDYIFSHPEIKTWGCQKQQPEVFFLKRLFLKILQNSRENTSVKVCFLIKLQARSATLLKRDSGAVALIF